MEWVKQSIEYLSRKGPIPNDLETLAGRVYTLFLDSDMHEIASEYGVLPPNSQGIESGMLSPSSVDVLLVLQVCDTPISIVIPPLERLLKRVR